MRQSTGMMGGSNHGVDKRTEADSNKGTAGSLASSSSLGAGDGAQLEQRQARVMKHLLWFLFDGSYVDLLPLYQQSTVQRVPPQARPKVQSPTGAVAADMGRCIVVPRQRLDKFLNSAGGRFAQAPGGCTVNVQSTLLAARTQ